MTLPESECAYLLYARYTRAWIAITLLEAHHTELAGYCAAFGLNIIMFGAALFSPCDVGVVGSEAGDCDPPRCSVSPVT